MDEEANGVEVQRVKMNFNNLTPFFDFGFAYSTPARAKTTQRSARFWFLLSNDAHDDYTGRRAWRQGSMGWLISQAGMHNLSVYIQAN